MIAFDEVVRHGCWLIKINIKRVSYFVHRRELDAIAHLQAFRQSSNEALSPRSMTFQDEPRIDGTQALDGCVPIKRLCSIGSDESRSVGMEIYFMEILTHESSRSYARSRRETFVDRAPNPWSTILAASIGIQHSQPNRTQLQAFPPEQESGRSKHIRVRFALEAS